MEKILFIYGKSQYDSTRFFLEEMREEISRLGVDTEVLDAHDECFEEKRRQVAGESFDAVITMNGMLLEQGSSLGKALLRDDVIYVTMLMDQPLIHHGRMKNGYPYSFVLCPDTDHVAYLERYYPQIWCEGFLAHAGCKAEKIVPYKERKFDISFMGSYIPPEKVYQEFETYPQAMQELMKTCVDGMLKDTDTTLEKALQETLQKKGIAVEDKEFVHVAAEFRVVDRYIRAYFRDKVVRTLVDAGVKLHVFGDGWDVFCADGKDNLLVHGRIDYKESLEVVADSRISLNVMPWFKQGSHDRVFSSMLCGSVCLTDSSTYLQQECKDGENIIFYSLEKLELLPHMVTELLAEEKIEEIAMAGKLLAEEKHTWAVRGRELLDYLFIASQMRDMAKEEQKLEKNIMALIPDVGSVHTGYHPQVIAALGENLQALQGLYGNYDEEYQKDRNSRLFFQVADIKEDRDEIYAKFMVELELLEAAGNHQCTDYFLEQLSRHQEIGWRNQFYLMRQLSGLLFTGSVTGGERAEKLEWKLYERIYTSFRQEVLAQWENNPGWIPKESRRENLVYVMTSQILSRQHAPTKTALDRCYILMKHYGKQVVLINTAEMGADVGNILLFHRFHTNYKKELKDAGYIEYKGIHIPYVQCSEKMPNLTETTEILNSIASEKPAYILNIGGGSLVSDLAGEMVPVLTIATVFSRLALTKSQFQMIGRPLTEKDRKHLALRKMTKQHVISGRFTFALKEQKGVLSREILGIPADRFALVVIGARLTREVTHDFVDMLLETVPWGGFIVFLGELDYEKLIAAHEKLEENSVYLGSRSDVLAVVEQTDMYVNPHRNGGGSSVVEAMYKGIVPVTLRYGDVYVNTGDDFAVDDYEAMKKEIVRCIQDKGYYEQQSGKSVQRAAELMDSFGAFGQVLEEFEKRSRELEKEKTPSVEEDVLNTCIQDGTEENQKKISIIVPCYNVEPYIRRCMDSLVAQTLGLENLLIIAVDDGSTDATLSILQEYERQYPEDIMLIPLEINQGQGAARNIALQYVSTDYVGFVDADNWVEPVMYEMMLMAAEKKEEDMAVCGYDRPGKEADAKRVTFVDAKKIRYEEIRDLRQQEAFAYQHRENVMCPLKLFRRSFLEDHQIRFLEGYKYEDHYFGMLVLLYAEKVAWVDEPLYHWYRNPKSTCSSGRHILDRVDVQRELYQECERRGLVGEFSSLLQYNLYEKMVAETIFYCKQKGEYTEDLLKQLMGYLQEMDIDIRKNPYYRQEILGEKPVKQQEKTVVDVLIAVAEKGGVENVIQMMIDNLESPGLHFRVVQMVWEGYQWLEEKVEFHPLLEGRSGHNLQEFALAYEDFLAQSQTLPNLVLVAGWPYLCTVAKVVRAAVGGKFSIVSWLHAGVKWYERAGYGGIEQMADADAHFAISEEIEQQLKKHFVPSLVHRVYNPVELPQVAEEQGRDTKKTLSYQLLFVGRFSPEKNIELLLQAIAGMKKWVLHLAGDGPEKENLLQIAENLEITKRVIWHGWQINPWECVPETDALVMASHYEGFGLTVLEAMGRGIPAITTKVGVATEVIQNGVTGYLYEGRSADELIEILHQIDKQGYVVQKPSLCAESAKLYEKTRVFKDMKEKMYQMLNGKSMKNV